MAVTKSRIAGNLSRIRDNIADARARSGRTDDVSIVAVTKTVGLDEIKLLLDAGMTELGENRVQQLQRRAEELNGYLQRKRNPLPIAPRWHMIGHLQRNKVKNVLPIVGVIHSLDSLRLAEEIQARAEGMGQIDVMLQVNCSKEPQKFGCAVGAAMHLGEMICTLENLHLIGLMTMTPITRDAEKSRPIFVRLRELFEEMCTERIGGDDLKELSMGMSQDYSVAVEEGATILRIGTALFE